MSVAYRSSSGQAYASRTNTTLTAPTGIQNGDILVIHFCLGSSSATAPSVTPPSGFTAVPGPTFPVASAQSGAFYVYNWTWYKVASSESGNYTVTHAANTTQAYIGAYSGADTSTPFGQNETSNPQNQVGTTTSGVNSSTTATGITTTRNGSLLVFISQDWGDTSNTLSGPTGYTKRYGVASSILYVSDEQQATAGATGNQTITNNSQMASGGTPTTNTDPWAGFLIAVQPPSGGTHGTLSATLGAVTSSATSTNTDHGTLSETLGSLSLSTGTAKAIDKNALSKTLGSLTLATTGIWAKRSATLSSTLALLTGPGYAPGAFYTNTGPTYVPSQSGTYEGGSTAYSSYSPTTPTISRGNAAFVLVGGVPSSGSAFTWTVTDNAGNTYHKVGNQVDGGGYNTALFYLLDIQGTPTQISLNQGVGGTISFASIVMDVFSGIPADYSLLGSGLNSQASAGSGTDAVTSGSFSLANPGAFIWGGSINVGSTGAQNPGTGFTQGQNVGSTFTTEYLIGATSGSHAATFTATDGGSGQYDSVGLALGLTSRTATLSDTLGSIGLNATGLVPVPPYSTSETLAGLAISSAGTVKGHATLGQTLGSLSFVGTGRFEVGRFATASVTLASLTAVSGMASSDKGSLTITLGALQLSATSQHTDHASGSATLAALTAAAVLSPIDKLTLSKTLGVATLHATAHNESTSHLTLSKTLGSVTGTFLTAKTTFHTVNPRKYATVTGYKPNTAPLQQDSVFGRYMLGELQKLTVTIQTLTNTAPQSTATAPINPQLGIVRYATGDWAKSLSNGEGLYIYKSTGWVHIA